MLRSLYSTQSIVFMNICTVLTTPMYLDRTLDTELRLGTLGTSSPGSGTNTITKLDEIASLDLTLAPSSGITSEDVSTKQFVPSEASGIQKTKFALGIQKTQSFKPSSHQIQSFRTTPDVESWLQDQRIQPANHVSHRPGNRHIVMPYNNLMFEVVPSSFLPHNLQESGSRNLPIQEDPTHTLPRIHGLGYDSVQGIPIYDPSSENFANLMQDQHSSIINSQPFKVDHFQTSKVSEEKRISATSRSQDNKSLRFEGKSEASAVPDSRTSYITLPKNTRKLSKAGRNQLLERNEMWGEILTWFNTMDDILRKKMVDDEVIRIQPLDIRRALLLARDKLTPAFFAYLVRHYGSKGQSNQELMSQGWKHLKSYMGQWQNVNLQDIVALRGIQVDSGVQTWTTAHILAYLMWVDGRKFSSFEILSKFISDWEKLKGI